ncbi:MAG: response regulator [Candidatus Methanofastidiosia archaeon]
MMARIFLVDDKPEIIALFKDLLELKGYHVIDSASDGEEAVLKYKKFKEKPDLVIMDHRMPSKDGLEATREILEFDPLAKIMFVSADESIKSKALESGSLAFKTKPIEMRPLLENVEKCL